jgi:DNA-binding response OmpR family regulator
MRDILIVEDSKEERERLEKFLTAAGYTVRACAGAEEAEQTIFENSFRLAILDIGLGDRSGSTVFNTLKRSGRAGHLVIFTGNPSVHLRQRFLDEGASDYIVKGSPAGHPDSLLSRVEELIGKPIPQGPATMDLKEFLEKFVPENYRKLFLEEDGSFPACSQCGAKRYVVSFADRLQVPPDIIGQVCCAECERLLNPEIK